MILRVLLAIVICVICTASYIAARRGMHRALRLPLDFCISLYVATFAIGCVAMFVLQTEYLYHIFGNQQFLPSRTSYPLVLLVGILPVIAVPWMVIGVDRAYRLPPGYRPKEVVISEMAMWMGTLVTLGVSLAIVWPVLPLLLSNALVGMQNTADLFQLYEQRRTTFDAITWLQGGVIYTTLPSVATMLLFWPSRRRFTSVLVGLGIMALVLLLNIGTFQIGPTLAYILTISFCYVCISGGRIDLRKVAVPVTLGIVLLATYSVIKTGGYQVDPIQAYIMRLPSALPYLIQYAGEQPGAVQSGDFTLTFELARYMYPSLVQYAGWIATPQPAFVDAFFTFNPLVGIGVLLVIAIAIVLIGRTLAAGWATGNPRNPLVIFVGILASPALYYVFQVDFVSLFNSAFSALFALPPIVGTLLVNSAIPRPDQAQRPWPRGEIDAADYSKP